MPRIITYIRHFEQVSHRTVDSPIKPISLPISTQYEYDYIISSPYLRCRQTAELINNNNKPIYIDVRLSEYQGHKNLKSFKIDPSSLVFGPIPGPNETWDSCAKRLDDHLNYILSLSGNILIVTHGIVFRYMQQKFFGYSSYAKGRNVPYGGGFTIQI